MSPYQRFHLVCWQTLFGREETFSFAKVAGPLVEMTFRISTSNNTSTNAFRLPSVTSRPGQPKIRRCGEIFQRWKIRPSKPNGVIVIGLTTKLNTSNGADKSEARRSRRNREKCFSHFLRNKETDQREPGAVRTKLRAETMEDKSFLINVLRPIVWVSKGRHFRAGLRESWARRALSCNWKHKMALSVLFERQSQSKPPRCFIC